MQIVQNYVIWCKKSAMCKFNTCHWRVAQSHLCQPPAYRCRGVPSLSGSCRSHPAAGPAGFQTLVLLAAELQFRSRPAHQQTPSLPSHWAASPARVRNQNHNLGAEINCVFSNNNESQFHISESNLCRMFSPHCQSVRPPLQQLLTCLP